MILMLKVSSNLGIVHFYYFRKHDLTQKESLDGVFGRWETGFNFFENWPKIVLEMGDWFFQIGSREHHFFYHLINGQKLLWFLSITQNSFFCIFSHLKPLENRVFCHFCGWKQWEHPVKMWELTVRFGEKR